MNVSRYSIDAFSIGIFLSNLPLDEYLMRPALLFLPFVATSIPVDIPLKKSGLEL